MTIMFAAVFMSKARSGQGEQHPVLPISHMFTKYSALVLPVVQRCARADPALRYMRRHLGSFSSCDIALMLKSLAVLQINPGAGSHDGDASRSASGEGLGLAWDLAAELESRLQTGISGSSPHSSAEVSNDGRTSVTSTSCACRPSIITSVRCWCTLLVLAGHAIFPPTHIPRHRLLVRCPLVFAGHHTHPDTSLNWAYVSQPC